MKTPNLVLFLFGLLMCTPTFGQLIPQLPQEADERAQMRWEMSQMENSARLQQSGNGNQVFLTQINRQYAQIEQRGSNHLAEVLLQGHENALQLNQRGDANTYLLTLEGNDTELIVRQTGVDNYILQELRGFSGTEIQVVQEGHGHQLIHREEQVGPLATPITITQRGPSLGRPVTVTVNPAAYAIPEQ